MKNVMIILLFLVISRFYAHGQCVIYVDRNTGAIGAGFNNDNVPTTFKECQDFALKNCKERGGTNCTEVFRSAKQGWWAIIIGWTSDGRALIKGNNGYSSKIEAENKVRNYYKMDGGVDADNIQVLTFYAYSNVKE